MTTRNRIRRSIRRGEKNPETVNQRNQKADKRYERWRWGLIMIFTQYPDGFMWWKRVPNQTIIHKGRKP